MGSMRIVHRLLALACKGFKDRTTSSIDVCTLHTIVHCLLSKALECMMLKISSQSTVFGILEMMYTPGCYLASPGSTWEKVAQPAIMVLNRNII